MVFGFQNDLKINIRSKKNFENNGLATFRIDYLEKFQFVINVSCVLRFVIKIINDKIFFWSIN